MNKIQEARLLKLAKFLEKLNPKNFNFEHIVAEISPTGPKYSKVNCGTVCCAVGWCPTVFPNTFEWIAEKADSTWGYTYRYTVGDKSLSSTSWEDIVEKFFGVYNSEIDALFLPSNRTAMWNNKPLRSKATGKQVAAAIKRFVKWKKKEQAKV